MKMLDITAQNQLFYRLEQLKKVSIHLDLDVIVKNLLRFLHLILYLKIDDIHQKEQLVLLIPH